MTEALAQSLGWIAEYMRTVLDARGYRSYVLMGDDYGTLTWQVNDRGRLMMRTEIR